MAKKDRKGHAVKAVGHRALGPTSFSDLFVGAGGSSGDPGAGELAKTIETELIPRLRLAFRDDDMGRVEDSIGAADHVAFLRMLLADDPSAPLRFVKDLEARGISTLAVITRLLPEAARELGRGWEDDTLSFTDVTLATAQLQKLLRYSSIVGQSRPFSLAPGQPSILLATARDEQHVMGVLITAEIFRRAGWVVTSMPCAAFDDVVLKVREEMFDVVGLSASTDRCRATLKDDVDDLVHSSRNAHIRLVVGGGLFQRDGELSRAIGADLCLGDAVDAPEQCQRLLSSLMVGY